MSVKAWRCDSPVQRHADSKGLTDMNDDTYEAFAVTYARVDRNAAANFLGGTLMTAPWHLTTMSGSFATSYAQL